MAKPFKKLAFTFLAPSIVLFIYKTWALSIDLNNTNSLTYDQLVMEGTSPRDTTALSIAVIGDSYASLFNQIANNFRADIETSLGVNTSVRVKGCGGATSRTIYQNIFLPNSNGSSTQKFVISKPEYCIVFAGVNDTNQQVGPSFYTKNMINIINLLLYFDIKPVILEIPSWEIKQRYSEKKIYEKLILRYRSLLTGGKGRIDNIQAYRNDFQKKLKQEGVADKIIYLKLFPSTNKDKINNQYFKDGIHLNSNGYNLLCTAIVKAISRDYLEQKYPRGAFPNFTSLQVN